MMDLMKNPPLMLLLMIMMTVIPSITVIISSTSILCVLLMTQIIMIIIMLTTMTMLSPIPYIIFLTMIGGLMVIFLYFTMSMWTKNKIKKISNYTMWLIPMIMMILIYLSSKESSMPKMETKLFTPNFNFTVIIILMMLLVMLILIIEIFLKMNHPLRRNLKIWG